MRRRVVITGMGVITPLGHSVKEMFDAQVAGRSGVGVIHRFNARSFPTSFAAEVKNFDLGRYVRQPEHWANCGVNSQFAAGCRPAGSERCRPDAGCACGPDTDRRLPRFRRGHSGFSQSHLDHRPCLSARGPHCRCPGLPREALRRFHPRREAEQELHTTAGHLAEYFELLGPNYNCLTACAASSQAIGEATELIRHNDADMMLAGGSHSMIHPLGLTGFNLLTALSRHNEEPAKASRPFDLRRDGFVLGEGSGMLVLEELEHARRRGANIYAELTGYGSTADAFRVTDSHPDGRGAIACIQGSGCR